MCFLESFQFNTRTLHCLILYIMAFVCALSFISDTSSCNGFSLLHSYKPVHPIHRDVSLTAEYQSNPTFKIMRSSLGMSDASDESTTPSKLMDMNNVEFTQGCTVQTTKEIKAFHVGKKGSGTYNGNTFVPIDWDKEGDDVPREKKCLVMPKGFRGVVNRVYDVNDLDASLPVLVKFVAGDSMGGEFEPPVSFLMHLEESEVEVVV